MIRIVTIQANWLLNPKWTPNDGKSTRPDYTNVPMLIGETPDAILTFNFNGKAVGISTASGPDAGIVSTSIDGGPWIAKDLFTSWSSGLHLPWYFTLYSTLNDGNHSLRLKMLSSKNSSSTGTICRIRYFFVSGTQFVDTYNSEKKNNPISIYSPAKGELLVLSNFDSPFSYTVFDRKGVVCAQNLECINNDYIRIPKNEIYFVEVFLNNTRSVNKIVL